MTAPSLNLILTSILLLLVSGCCSAGTARAADEKRRVEALATNPREEDLVLEGPEACGDAALVTIADLARNQRVGERVAVDGHPTTGEFMCTEVLCVDGCGDKLPCCNSCGSVLVPGAAR